MLDYVETCGVAFADLETMAGTTVLGLLAIKNNVPAFLRMLSLYKDKADALNAPDIYGNTPAHYFALRGVERCGMLAHIREMGARTVQNCARQSPEDVLASRRIVCCEPGQAVGASFCADRLLTSIAWCA